MNTILFNFYLANKKIACMEIPVIHIYSQNSDIKFYIQHALQLNAVVNSLTQRCMHITIKNAQYTFHIDEIIYKIIHNDTKLYNILWKYIGYSDESKLVEIDMLTLCKNFINNHFGHNIYTINGNVKFCDLIFVSQTKSKYDIDNSHVRFILKNDTIFAIQIGDILHHMDSEIWQKYIDNDGTIIFKSYLDNDVD
jgi:hypothetical protein